MQWMLKLKMILKITDENNICIPHLSLETICRYIHITFHQFIKICNILKFAGSCVVVTILQIVYTLYISLKTRNILCHQIVFILHLHVYRTVSSIICRKKWIWILWKRWSKSTVRKNCLATVFTYQY